MYVLSGRDIENPDAPRDPFGNERGHSISMGVAYVELGANLTPEQLLQETTTPRKRKKARVVFDRFELSKVPLTVDPWRVKDDVPRYQANPWVQAIRAELDRSAKRDVTIYVHGYNTDFIDNTLIAGELFHYFGRQGAMVTFEWPSADKLLGYIQDKSTASYSTRQFRAVISNIAKECDVDSITIIGHSAGAPIVVNALRELRLLEYDLSADEVCNKYRVGRVVLAAADMDVMAFTNAVHDRFYELTKGVAIYSSPKDKALRVAERLNGYTRLGNAVGQLDPVDKELLIQVPEIELIDVTEAIKQIRNLIGHSYFHRDPWVSSDIGAFILGQTPTQRSLVRSPSEPEFWQFPADYVERLEQIAQQYQTR